MKKMLLVAMLSVFSVFAQAKGHEGHHDEMGKDHPCHDVKMACEAGGYTKGHHKKEGKGLMKDCMTKLAAGETVPGVTVTPEQLTACKAKMDEHGEHK